MFPKEVQLHNQTVVIREAVPADAAACIAYVKTVDAESEYLSREPGEFRYTEEEEKAILEKYARKDNKIFLVATINGEIVGLLNYDGESKVRARHMGYFGISILKKYWNQGIGSTLMESMVQWAKSTGIVRKINLSVDERNERAINLYKKFGFQVEGTLKRETCIDGEFYDAYYMGLCID